MSQNTIVKTKFNKNWKWIIIFLLPAFVLYALFFIYPLIMVVITSLTDWTNFRKMNFVGFKNYLSMFKNPTFLTALKNNFIWAFVLAFVQIPLAASMACVLARRPKGWKFYRTVYFLPSVISGSALAMMWKAIYNPTNGVLNAILKLFGGEGTTNWLGSIQTALPSVIVQQVFYFGYFMVIIFASRLGISESFYEAAMIDGANVWQQERYITVPMLRPILITTITLALAYGFRHFESTYLLTTGGPNHVTETMGTFLYTKLTAAKWAEANSIGTTIILLGGILISGIRSFLNRKGSMD